MKRILVGVDGSPEARAVLEAAVRLARTADARLVLVRAVALPVELPSSIFTVTTDSALGVLRDSAEQQLHHQAEAVPPELLEGMHVRVGGSPWQAICDTAIEENADLIVIGSHGYSGLDRILGTTASKVVNHADRSVLVVRAPERLAL